MQRRSTIACFMCFPLLTIIFGLVVYPTVYSIYLALLNKKMTQFIGIGNFTFLMDYYVAGLPAGATKG
ncbi:MAG: hypothetical protein EXR05_01025 [Acetobacteraceae bacterium]|nr:hypothetical protein [Acetobacteraceae bacterium]MSP30075.1 hypothetical protein [Acetobacteraceae bacterium]